MPYRYSIDKEKRLVVSTGTGVVTFAELMANTEQLTKDPDFDPDFHQLVDATGMTELSVSVEQAKMLARMRVFSKSSRRAMVAPSPSAYGMMRLWSAHHEQGESASKVTVFYDLASAREWLGLDEK